MDRQYELIVFGATGYTGQYTVEHITTHLPTDLKWAVAGRSEAKLKKVVDDLKQLNPNRTAPGVEISSLEKSDLVKLAKKTKLLISLVGPYHAYGTPVVEACVENGTHYIDATGETPWHYDIINKYDAKAKKSGAIIIPQNGIESAPADLMTFSLVSHLRNTQSIGAAEVINTIYDFKGSASGGTLATVLTIFDTYSVSQFMKSAKRWAWCPIPTPQEKTPAPALLESITGVRTVQDLGVLTDSLSRSADTPMVHRTWALLDSGKFYGPKFHFSAYMKARNIFQAFTFHVALGLGALLLLLSPFRALTKRFVFQPGQGVSKEKAKREYIEWRGIAYPDTPSGKRAFGVMKFGGGMYHLTGIFQAEAAITILRDKTRAHEIGGGLLTPATLGDAYLERLGKAGLKLDTRTLE